MRLDYKSIITKHYLLHMSGAEIADELNVSYRFRGERAMCTEF